MLISELNWYIFEGYISETPVGGSKNYIPIQLFVMYLISGGNPVTTMHPTKFLQIAKAFPIAVNHIINNRNNLDLLEIPQLTVADKNSLGDKWAQVPEKSKEVIEKIYKDVLNLIRNK